MPEVSSPLGGGGVVHVVGKVTDEVFSFLGPALAVLARAGRMQRLVMIDDPRYRHHLAALPSGLDLHLTPATRNPIRRWLAVLKKSREVLGLGDCRAVHLHGLLPCLVGVGALRATEGDWTIVFSPHASRSMRLLRVTGHLIRYVMRPLLRRHRHSVIVNLPREAGSFVRWKTPNLVESPIRAAFVDATRHEARRPLIVTGGRDQTARNAELFSQLAVLLSGESIGASFNWIGWVDALTQARLTAAGIGVFEVESDVDCASRLSAGWVYVAAGSTRGFPYLLVEAMAVGLPCVAIDCPQHRDVIVDGKTGYLCATDHCMMVKIAALIDQQTLRERIGMAARATALQRFTESEFTYKLLAAYDAHAPIDRRVI